MATLPTHLPASIVAGDTFTLTQTLRGYPASGWSLHYALINGAGKITFDATAQGDDHLISVSAATTASWLPGDYDYLAWVEQGSGPSVQRVTLQHGRTTIAPNLATATTYDGRSAARQIYESLVAAYKAAVSERAFVAEYELLGRRMKFADKTDWLNEINYWKAQVAAEDRAARLAAGLGGRSRVLVRF